MSVKNQLSVALGAGTVYAVTYTIFSFVLLWGQSVPRQGEGVVLVAGALAYFGVGMVVLCGVPTFLAARFGLVSPLALFGLFVALSTVGDIFISGPEFYSLYLTVWYLFLVPMVAAGAVEYAVREGLSFHPPRPVV
ncbi:hypothetical protein OB920_18840 [Halobacteria archaeon HArc-gm2]|nr:hypothetical protein [Halobacteria archaeon HArc-gm2]